MEIFIEGVLKGAPTTSRRHIQRANKIKMAIESRWNIRHPAQYQVKHLRWFLAEHIKFEKPDVRYQYWLTVKLIVERREKDTDWLPLLKGEWDSPARTSESNPKTCEQLPTNEPSARRCRQ